MSSQSISLGDKLNALKKGIYDYVPGTVNINQRGAVDNTTIDWTDQSVHRQVPKHVMFVTLTPLKPQVEDIMDNEILAVPLPQEASTSQRQMVPGQEQSTINIITNEFQKPNPPKLQQEAQGLYAELLGYVFFLNCRDIVYNIFGNVQLLWLLHSIGPSP